MKFYLFFLAAGICLGARITHAAEWTTDASINQVLSYDNNVRMIDDKLGSFVYKLTPVLNAGYQSLNSMVAVSASYGIERFEHIPELNREHQNYSLRANFQSERVTYSILTDYKDEPARDSAAVDTGDFNINTQKADWLVEPSIDIKVTEIDTLNVKARYRSIAYSEEGLSDHQNTLFTLGWKRRWSERYTGGVSVIYFRNDTDQILQNMVSNSYAINIFNRYLLSEHWSVTIGLGYRYTDLSDTLITAGEEHGFLTNSSLNYSGEALFASASIKHSLMPNGLGELNNHTESELELGYWMTERLSLSLQGQYVRNDALNVEHLRHYLSISPSISWKATPELIVSGAYRFRLQNDDAFDYVSNSSTFMLTLAYNWQGLSVSR